MKQAILSLKDVSFGYGDKCILQDVTFQVPPGTFLAVLGPNGGGKTTLIKLMLGLLKPWSGQIKILGTTPGTHARSKIGYLPQYSNGQKDFPITVEQVVLLGLMGKNRLRRLWRSPRFSKEEKDRARQALKRLEVDHLAPCQMSTLSGGQQQRVLIARALVSDPALLILDEPTSNIDPQTKFCLYDFLSTLTKQMAIIVVSHDLSITNAGITALACVNKRVLYTPGAEISREMFALLYGLHDHKCPMSFSELEAKNIFGRQTTNPNPTPH